jgi:hypothetical protein
MNMQVCTHVHELIFMEMKETDRGGQFNNSQCARDS